MVVQKSSNQFNWDDVRYFLALVDCGTVSATAARLGVNHVTVSRRVDRLEESIDRVLFDRRNEGYFLTLEGEALCKQLSAVSDTFERISSGVRNTEIDTRIIKISTLHTLAESIIAPTLAALQKKHDTLKIELDVSTRNVNIAKREADIAIRLGLPESGEFLSRRVCNLRYQLMATETLCQLVKNGKHVPTITFGSDFSYLPEAQYMYEHFDIESIALRSNSAAVQFQAAKAGMGIALLPAYLMQGSELRAIEMQSDVQREVWMLTRKQSADINSVTLVKDALAAMFKENQSLLEQRH